MDESSPQNHRNRPYFDRTAATPHDSLACKGKLFKLRGVSEEKSKPEVPNSLTVSVGSDTTIFDALQRRESVVIGRAPDCDVVIQDLKASRRHCQLTRKESGFLLEDLGSRNGTLVNGTKITSPMLLKVNQTFQIGDTMFYLT